MTMDYPIQSLFRRLPASGPSHLKGLLFAFLFSLLLGLLFFPRCSLNSLLIPRNELANPLDDYQHSHGHYFI